MMQSILELLQYCFEAFIWWTVIEPWEQGVRVRLGKGRTRLGPGIHFKIPYVDKVFKQPTRRLYTNFGPISVTTSDGQTLTLSGALGYVVKDLDRLYDTLQHAEDGIHAIAAGAVTEHVANHTLAECSPAQIVEGARKLLRLRRFGLSVAQLTLTSYAKVRVIRLITDADTASKWGDGLDTESHHA